MLAMWMPGPLELVVIGIVGFLVFGRKLPEMISGITKSLKEFRKGLKDE
jgi:TatA/E family protein of Tat protein translocase